MVLCQLNCKTSNVKYFLFQATAFLIHMIPSISPQTHTPHTYAHYVPSEVQPTSLYYQDTNKAPPVHIGAF